MTHIWQLQEAKNKFKEVVEAALTDGPQLITKRGVETAVVLSFADYRKLLLSQEKLSDFFRESPLVGVKLDLDRDPSLVRSQPIKKMRGFLKGIDTTVKREDDRV